MNGSGEGRRRRRIAVIGAGGWGTALAHLLAGKGHAVTIWAREREVRDNIREGRSNPVFLPGVELNQSILPVSTYEEALSGCELVVLAAPSHVVREVVEGLKAYLAPGVPVVSAAKGIENQTLMTVSEVVAEVLPELDSSAFACLAGPSFAREVALGYPTAVTVASRDHGLARSLQGIFYTEYFRVYTSQDIVGTELGGALKNVIAIGAGVADGLGFGHNARAALITRGLAEITRLAVAMGAVPLTLAGLAGMGDLVLTCTGELSRNRTVGLKIGQGLSLDEIQSGMSMVAEGVRTALSAHELGKREAAELPITDQVYEILYRGKEPRVAVRQLMTRELKVELEH